MTRTGKHVKKEPDEKPEVPPKDSTKSPEKPQTGTESKGATPQSVVPGGKQPTGRKPLGHKEVPRFEWKLLGESHGMILTLFKAVDRTEVEAQLGRVQKEGYYTNLRIVDADMKIKQPKPVQQPKRARKGVKPTRKAAAATKTTKKASAKSAKSTKKKKKATPAGTKATASATKTSTKKTREQTATKTTRKKAPKPKSTKKATTKKK